MPLGYEYRARYSAQLEDVADQSEAALPRSIELIMEKIQLERRNLIDESCRKITWRRQSRPARFYVEDRHRLMYCYVPKVRDNCITFIYIESDAILILPGGQH
jgi:hypothetical protein